MGKAYELCLRRWRDILNTKEHANHVCRLAAYHAAPYHLCDCGARLHK